LKQKNITVNFSELIYFFNQLKFYSVTQPKNPVVSTLHAKDQNVQYIKGDLAKRDWDHLDRLIHFYDKHDFEIHVDYDDKSGEITWNSSY
jgi:hypothetical protein